MKVVIQNQLLKKYLPVKEMKLLLEKVAKSTLEIEKFEIPALVSVLLVENEEIQRINQEFRNKTDVTDVLSFPMLDMHDGKLLSAPGLMDMEDGRVFLGDIVISVPKALEQAHLYGHSAERELAFLLVHGLLHLLGYDHDPEREETMQKKQEEILIRMGIGRNEASER